MGPSVFLSSADGHVRELLELSQGCQGPFWGSGGKVGFCLRCRSGKGPQLAWRGEPPGFSRVAVGFLTRYDGDLRDPLVWPQERPVSMPVAMGLSGILSHQCQVLSPGLEPRPETYVSSPVLTWILGFLWSLHRGVRPRLERDMHLCFPPQL